MRALEKLREISKILREKNITSADKEAHDIVCHVLKIDKVKLYSHDPEIDKNKLKKIDNIVLRRLKREPLQYLIGECDFFNIKIKIGKGVLIPRPETEILVEEFIKIEKTKNKKYSLVLDLCTGSGCIALAIAKNLPYLKVFGVDISERAILYAKKNKKINNISNAFFIVGDLFYPFRKNSFLYITANPPYVKTQEIECLQPEIKYYEPKKALNGGKTGLFYYEKILNEATDYLLHEGLVFLEIGKSQVNSIEEIANNSGFKIVKIVNDLAGIERVMILKRC